MWPNAQNDLNVLNSLVAERALIDVESGWSEVVREFCDERSYLSVSLTTRPNEDQPIVQIEFGVQDERQRHATGGFVGRWLVGAHSIEGIEIIILDGNPCDLSDFVRKLAGYTSLPSASAETAER